MTNRRVNVSCVALTLASMVIMGCATAKQGRDDFNKGTFWHSVWDLCQATESLIWFDRANPREGKYSLIIRADNSLTDVACFAGNTVASVEESTEDLGPSMIIPDDRIDQLVLSAPVERNELRLLKPYKHLLTETHTYGMSFKVSGDMPTKGSIRWVIGQWKHSKGDSPYLAQRFDNGVFHITVQVDDCRCRVAKGLGDPERFSRLNKEPALFCRGSGDQNRGEECEPIKYPGGNKLELKVVPGSKPTLPDPSGDWVDMVYSVRAGWDGKARIKICANKQHIATVTGPIGYETWKNKSVKFKIGNYRDTMPGSADLHLDKFWFRAGTAGTDNCKE